MFPKIVNAKYVGGFTINLFFSDGAEGEIDLEEELDGDIFQPLKNIAYFKTYLVNHELHTLTWPNGADFAPEFLYDKLRVVA